jgi:Arc/MetJ-type ribon-helix-helix transcriptional regulator
MEHVSVKLEDAIARQIETDMKEFRYTTKTEFIRESIRDKLKANDEERRKKKAWEALVAARGIFKGKGKTKTDEEWYQWRKENGDKFAKELAEKYGWKL